MQVQLNIHVMDEVHRPGHFAERDVARIRSGNLGLLGGIQVYQASNIRLERKLVSEQKWGWWSLLCIMGGNELWE